MISIGRLISLLVPSSLLGLSYFWWRWKQVPCASDKKELVEEHLITGSIEEDKDEISPSKDSEDILDDIQNECHILLSQNVSQLDCVLPDCVDPCSKETCEELVLEEVILPLESECPNDLNLQDLRHQIMCDDESVIDLQVDTENPKFSATCNMDEMTSSQVSSNDDNSTCSSRKRLCSKSSCGDSAYVEDYSSDTLSTTGYDSAVKSSEGEFSTPRKCKPVEENEKDLHTQESKRAYRDWYSSGLVASSLKERPDTNRHWGSIPVSDSESEGDCILKCTAKVGCMSLDELNVQLNEELTKVKSQRESISNTGRRRPRQNRRRERKKSDSSKNSTKTTPKKASKPKDHKQSHKQKEKSSCCPKKGIDKAWRADSSSTIDEKNTLGKREVVEYEFPDDMCGRLIGKSGRHISEFKESTGVDICIEGELHGKNRIVSMTGVRAQIKKAEKILNEKFHDSLKIVCYPDMEMTVNNLTPISLIKDTEYDIIVTAVVDVGSFYVQIFDKDVDQGLTELQIDLAGIYTTPRPKYIYHADDIPNVDEYCVTYVDNTWCRLKVTNVFLDTQTVEAFFIDYGGSVTLSFSRIWKIRSDMLMLKPQAVLCDLHEVIPLQGGGAQFSFAANDIFYQIIGGNVLKALVVSVDSGNPSVRLWYYSEEKKELMSVSEQMHMWGLVMDRSLLKLNDCSDGSSSELVDDTHEEPHCFPRHNSSLTSSYDCSSQSFICAS